MSLRTSWELSKVSGELLLATFAEVERGNAASAGITAPRCVQSIHPIGARNERPSLFPEDSSQQSPETFRDAGPRVPERP